MTYDWRVLAGVAAASALAGWLIVRQPAEPEVDLDEIDRDLATLAEALQRDQTIEADVLPPNVANVELPSSLPYRRPVKFWEPAFAPAPKGQR